MTFEKLGLDSPALVSDANGVLHMVYTAGPTPDSTFEYARCAQNCGLAVNWTTTVVDTGTPWTNRPRLVVGSDGRLHALYETDELQTQQTVYSTCAANCSVPSSWTKSYLTSLFVGWSAEYRGAPLVIDDQHRLSFVVSDLTIHSILKLATCATGCTDVANWSVGVVRDGGGRTAMAARGTTLHAVVYNDVDSLVYRTCSSNCTEAANWQESPPLFIHDGIGQVAVVVTAQNGVRVAYNQGVSAADQSAAIKAQDSRLLVWSCDANCLVPANWAGVILGDVREGEAGLSMAEAGGALVLSLVSTVAINTRVCLSGCTNAAQWGVSLVDSAELMALEYDPYVYGLSGCSSRPSFAAWYPVEGSLAIRPDGSLAFANANHMLRTCPGQSSPSYLPGFGRVVFLP